MKLNLNKLEILNYLIFFLQFTVAVTSPQLSDLEYILKYLSDKQKNKTLTQFFLHSPLAIG